MKWRSFYKRVDFTYIIGAVVSLFLLILSIFLYKDSGFPMAFSTAAFFTYAGVIIRGIIDPNSWGNTLRKKKISAFVGFTSIFVVAAIETVLLITKSMGFASAFVKNAMIIIVIFVMLLYVLIYSIWFRKLSFE
jgi:hypothetical protein